MTSAHYNPAWASGAEMLINHTCNPNEDCEAKADQEQHEDQDKMSFGQGVEPHGGQSVTERHALELTHTQAEGET